MYTLVSDVKDYLFQIIIHRYRFIHWQFIYPSTSNEINIFFCEILVYIISADGSNQRVLFVTAILCETKRISFFFTLDVNQKWIKKNDNEDIIKQKINIYQSNIVKS